MSRAAVAVVVTALTFAARALAGWTRTAPPAEARFNGSGPGGFKLAGKTAAVDVKDDGKALTVVVALKDLSTGIALRDTHMRDKYLEVQKYPETTLSLPLAALTIPVDGKDGEGDVKGNVTLHGVTKEQAVHYKASCKAGVCDVTGTLPLDMHDYGIHVPAYLGITVKPLVNITVTFQAKRP